MKWFEREAGDQKFDRTFRIGTKMGGIGSSYPKKVSQVGIGLNWVRKGTDIPKSKRWELAMNRLDKTQLSEKRV